MTDKKLAIEIGVGVKGSESVDGLTQKVDQLGTAGADAGKAATSGAQGLDKLDAAAKGAGGAIGQAGSELGQLAAAEKSAAAGAGQVGGGLTQVAVAAGAASGKLDATGRGLDDVSAHADGAAKHLASLRDQLIGAFAFKELVQAAAEMEKVKAGFQAVSGDAKLAGEQMDFVRRMAQAAGVDVAAAGQAYLGLAAATKGTAVEGEPARRVFEAVTVAMAKAGKGSAETQNALLALSQMASKGTVQMEELRGQLSEALPGALQAAADGMGITTADLIKLAESGKLTAEDIFPALAKGLDKLYGTAPAAQTLSQEITNIKNAFIAMADDIGQAGGLDALKVGAELAQMAIVLLGDTLVQTGQYVGTLVAAVTTLDFSGLSAAFKQIEDDSRNRLLKAAEYNDVLRKALQLSSDEATKAALTARDAGQAHEGAGKAAAAAGDSVAKLGVQYAKAREEITKQIDLADKEVEAVKARGQAAVAQASLLNDEAAKRRAVGQAAADEAKAIDDLAGKKAAELQVLQQELSALQMAVGTGAKVSDARKKEIEDLQTLIAQKTVDVEKTNAQAAAAREHAKATGELVQKTTAAREAAEAMNITRLAEARASVSLLETQKTLARQTEDMAHYMGNEEEARRAHLLQLELDIKLTKAKAEVAKVEAEGTIAVARAKLAELEASGQLTPLKKAEIEATIKLAEAKLLEAKAAGANTDLLQKQLDRLREMPPAANAAGGAVKEHADAQERSAEEVRNNTVGLNGQIDAFGRFTARVGKATEELKRFDEAGYELNTVGQRVNMALGNGKTYSPEQADGAVGQAQAKYDKAMKEYQRLDWNVQHDRAFNGAPIVRTGVTPETYQAQVDLVRQAATEAAVAAQAAQAELAAARAAAAQARATEALSGAGLAIRYDPQTGLPVVMSSTGYDATTGARSTDYASAGSSGRSVTIDLTGLGLTRRSITVGSDADAAALEAFLRELGSAASRAGP